MKEKDVSALDPSTLDEAPSRRHGYGLRMFFLYLTVGLMAVMAYAFNMRAMGWESSRTSGLSVPVAQMLNTEDQSILLYASEDTARYLASVGGNYEVLLKPWRNFFTQEKIPYKEISRLEKIEDPRRTVLVLPSAVALEDTERKAILEFRDRGGNILATSTLAARNGRGEWTGYDFVKDLFGVSVTGDIPPEKEERHLNLFGDLPFALSYNTAERIWLGKMGANPLRLKGGKTAGVITDWARISGAGNSDTAAVLYDEFGKDKQNARWVMLSFSETTWEVQRNAVHALLANSLDWLEHRPAIYKASWPYPYRAAHVIEMDTEEGFPNALRFAAMLDQAQVPSTFYVLTSVALRNREILKKIARNHEIGYHGDVHDGFKGQPETVQARRMDAMQADLKSLLGNLNGITGFRAPVESYDKTTEDLLLKKGIRHHAADPNRTNARLPLFYPNSKYYGQALVILPRTQLDDINLLQAGKNDKTLIADALIRDYEQVAQMGAFGLLSIHTQNFAENSPLAAAMPDFLSHVAKNRSKVWLAQSGKVADWWRERERLTYKLRSASSRIDLDVTIEGNTPMQAVSLIVAAPMAKAVVNLKPLKSNTALPQVKPIDDFRTALVFSDMRPGSYSYSLTFAKD